MSPAEPGHASGALKPGPEVREMFGRIVGRYDLMNRLMTGGRDVAWRNLAVRAALSGYPCGTARVVDVATGTGELALAEMTRVLRPGGRFVCLEMTPLRTPLVGTAFGWYFERVVPLLGGLLSSDREAYRYLPASVAAFPDAPALASMMERAGLTDVHVRKLGGGTVALHTGVKARGGEGSPVSA